MIRPNPVMLINRIVQAGGVSTIIVIADVPD